MLTYYIYSLEETSHDNNLKNSYASHEYHA
jgi:hypothetical protein